MTRTVAEKYHSSTALVPVTAYHNQIVPTQQEAMSLYDKEHLKLNDEVSKLDQLAAAHGRRAHRIVRELVEETPEDRATDPFSLSDKAGRLAKAKKEHESEGFWGVLKVFLGLLLSLFLLFIIVPVDYALFVALFREGYLDRFGDLPVDMQSVVALLAGQAVVGVAGFHYFLHSAKARAIAAAAIGILLLIFLGGVVVHRGFAEVAKASATAAATPFGWELPKAPVQTADVPLLETVAVFALGIPYLALPLIAALVGWGAFIAIRDGLKARTDLRRFSTKYSEQEEGFNAGESVAAEAGKLRQEWSIRVKAPVVALVDVRLKQADILADWLTKNRMFGKPMAGNGLIPGTEIALAQDPEFVARMVVEAKAILDTFVDRTFEAWRVSRGLTPERMGGI